MSSGTCNDPCDKCVSCCNTKIETQIPPPSSLYGFSCEPFPYPCGCVDIGQASPVCPNVPISSSSSSASGTVSGKNGTVPPSSGPKAKSAEAAAARQANPKADGAGPIQSSSNNGASSKANPNVATAQGQAEPTAANINAGARQSQAKNAAASIASKKASELIQKRSSAIGVPQNTEGVDEERLDFDETSGEPLSSSSSSGAGARNSVRGINSQSPSSIGQQGPSQQAGSRSSGSSRNSFPGNPTTSTSELNCIENDAECEEKGTCCGPDYECVGIDEDNDESIYNSTSANSMREQQEEEELQNGGIDDHDDEGGGGGCREYGDDDEEDHTQENGGDVDDQSSQMVRNSGGVKPGSVSYNNPYHHSGEFPPEPLLANAQDPPKGERPGSMSYNNPYHYSGEFQDPMIPPPASNTSSTAQTRAGAARVTPGAPGQQIQIGPSGGLVPISRNQQQQQQPLYFNQQSNEVNSTTISEFEVEAGDVRYLGTHILPTADLGGGQAPTSNPQQQQRRLIAETSKAIQNFNSVEALERFLEEQEKTELMLMANLQNAMMEIQQLRDENYALRETIRSISMQGRLT